MEYFNQSVFDELQKKALNSPRKRANLNVHANFSDPVQRLFISIAPGTYVRPHKHCQSSKFEFFLMVSGKATMLIFEDDGTLLERHELDAMGERKGLEIPPGIFHTLFPGTEPATFLEVKPGPYQPLEPEEFANWSPEEGSEEVSAYLERLYILKPGQSVGDRAR